MTVYTPAATTNPVLEQVGLELALEYRECRGVVCSDSCDKIRAGPYSIALGFH